MSALRYPCLVLDHDDTVMDSTAHVHWPAFEYAMTIMRPGVSLTLEEYFRMNFHPGFTAYCRETLGFSPAEEKQEYEIWQEFVRTHIPEVYPGMARIIRRQTELGGRVCVVSHSVRENILRDYRENGLPEPELVYGWELPHALRKPAPYALQKIMEQLALRPEELLVVDDLKPGFDMAHACGVRFAAAGWAYDIPQIRDFMKENSDVYFDTPSELERYLFD